jgi:transglutaminase-like putative cysteine protease
MRNRLSYNLLRPRRATDRHSSLFFLCLGACLLLCAPRAAAASDSPPWMQSLTSVSLPSYDEKTDAVLLYSETSITVLSADKIKTRIREAYKILRPEGRRHGNVFVYFHSPGQKVTSLHGWCIPAQGKDFEVKDKDAVDLAPPGVEGGELIDDIKARVLRIPAPDPGNIIGYEYEVEERPLVLQSIWHFQEDVPTRESHFSVQLPSSWEYKASWINYPEVKPSQGGSNQWEWVVTDVKAIREEPRMPPWSGVAGKVVVSFFAAGGPALSNGYADWRGMGNWYSNLLSDRLNASTEIKEQVGRLTASKTSALEKMRALAEFLQRDIRYVAIELGIGGWQPHPAADVFLHRYGDCKDKATLLRTMLREIGVDSYHVVINTQRGSVTPDTPAYRAFNHAILAVRLPDGLTDPSLIATMQHPKLGRILFFDPTDPITPFGQIRGELQANYGLLVAPDGGELVRLPQQPSTMNGIQRTAKFTLDPMGTLKGEVQEVRLGDRAWSERWQLRSVTSEKDRIKPIESLLAGSLANFQITHASLINPQRIDLPFGFNYSFESQKYAKNAGNMLLVRPRVLGVKSMGFLETREPRKFAVEFEGPVRDTDTFEITIPAGYEVGDLPTPVDTEYSFASYHSKTEVNGGVIRYNRTFEVKELSVPVDKTEELRKFYRTIANDERSTVVLKASKNPSQ